MGKSQSSIVKSKDYLSNFYSKNLDENLRNYSSYLGIKSTTESLNSDNHTVASSIKPVSNHNNIEDLVEFNFVWKDTVGKDIYVTGSFVDWKQWFNLENSGEYYSRKIHLPRDKHLFKFIIDNDWKSSNLYETLTDDKGNVNNVIDLNSYEDNLKHDKPHESSKSPVKKERKKHVTTSLKSFCNKLPQRSSLNNDAPLSPCSYITNFSLIENLSQLKKGNIQFLEYESNSVYKFYCNSNYSIKQITLPPCVNM